MALFSSIWKKLEDRFVVLFLLLGLFSPVVVVSEQNATSKMYRNPVTNDSFLHPSLIMEHDEYYMVSSPQSQKDADVFRISRSRDLLVWDSAGFVFPSVLTSGPTWAAGDFSYPKLHRVGENRFCVFFTAKNREDGLAALGVACSTIPTGPYTNAELPLLQNTSAVVGDASFFADRWFDGRGQRLYLLFSLSLRHNTEQSFPNTTYIYSQRLSDDGTELLPNTLELLISNDQPWEFAGRQSSIHAPFLMNHHGWYYLFYSANPMGTLEHCVCVARAKTVTGPYNKFEGPILHTKWNAPYVSGGLFAIRFSSPGFSTVIPVVSNSDTLYAIAYQVTNLNTSTPVLFVDRIQWLADADSSWPRVWGDGPSTDWRAMPQRWAEVAPPPESTSVLITSLVMVAGVLVGMTCFMFLWWRSRSAVAAADIVSSLPQLSTGEDPLYDSTELAISGVHSSGVVRGSGSRGALFSAIPTEERERSLSD
eukprot:gnl/Spiro4/957_TR505_c0_g1_i1.p1 gnl/Spiro4/957_TR505_c0_g1~~gnl/Spiro4/957_TR505_c0_g1_i1.p1  ORF type:complete len:479 (+),score=61.49 gnl/Spiro4/957_TR505_c0_g1_i1:182-1618(+)